ncbi:MAG: type II toxin-antitoxin system VapC family toxin [Chloroflexota bacterium]
MRQYLDTNALVKSLVVEDGTDLMSEVMRSGSFLSTCRVTYPEARSALATARRASRIDDGQHAVLRRALDEDHWPRLSVVEVTEELAQHAGDLAERHALRGFDAVHLAAALAIAGDDMVMVTWDRRLAGAARDEGLRVLPTEPSAV